MNFIPFLLGSGISIFHGEYLCSNARLTDAYLYGYCEPYEETFKAPDTVRVLFPIDINKDIILSKLRNLIYRLGAVRWNNESDYSCETQRLIEQVEIYDEIWKQKHGTENGHSPEATELMREFVRVLREEVPDGGSEGFPFTTILELSREYGLGIKEEDIW